jgi:hypothetical protein
MRAFFGEGECSGVLFRVILKAARFITGNDAIKDLCIV